MPLQRLNGSEIAPCIISKVKYALGIKTKSPTNNKTCSNEYWNEVVELLGKRYRVTKDNIEASKR